MNIRFWRWITMMFVALSMAPALAHFLEMPAKLSYPADFWLKVAQTLYGPGFGTFGSAFEAGAVLTTPILVFVVRRRGAAFAWTLGGALCVLVSHAIFWVWIAPVNTEVARMTLETMPADWARLRQQWEYTHAVRAVLQILGLASLVMSVLVETPKRLVEEEPGGV
jgi:hypothetical protein